MPDVDSNTIDLTELSLQVVTALAGCNYKTLVNYADVHGIDYDSADHIIDGIKDMLLDPYTGSSLIIDFANEVIDDKSFTYEGDSIVSVEDKIFAVTP